jgi:hypothetical protein
MDHDVLRRAFDLFAVGQLHDAMQISLLYDLDFQPGSSIDD